MKRGVFFVLLFFSCTTVIKAGKFWRTTDELENHISPEDLKEFIEWCKKRNGNATTTVAPQDVDVKEYADSQGTTTGLPVPHKVDCFGLGPLLGQFAQFLNMKPDSVEDVNTHYYFSSRKQPNRVQVNGGSQFGLEWVDFDPSRKTILIVHGFLSHSNASWVLDMTRAFLEWEDVNVIAADWSGGGNTLKYWRAVANTRRVGSDITGFLKRLIQETGARLKDFHFIGHSLGAHIASYASVHIGRVARITGLDPAQPCFRNATIDERLDESDADFVDVIHTNGRLLRNIGLGLPDRIGNADFYPNGGMSQPGCANSTSTSLWARLLPISSIPFVSRLQQSICSHGRAYLLFTESLINNNCTFKAHKWNLSYEGVNVSLSAACSRRISPCSIMGIRAAGGLGLRRAEGAYIVPTSEKQPYCQYDVRFLLPELLRDLRQGLLLGRPSKPHTTPTPAYADPIDDITATPTTEKTVIVHHTYNILPRVAAPPYKKPAQTRLGIYVYERPIMTDHLN